MANVFRFTPGERLLLVVGMPGPDTEPCVVASDKGGKQVTVRIMAKGKVQETTVPRDRIMWLRGSETSKRFNEWGASHRTAELDRIGE